MYSVASASLVPAYRYRQPRPVFAGNAVSLPAESSRARLLLPLPSFNPKILFSWPIKVAMACLAVCASTMIFPFPVRRTLVPDDRIQAPSRPGLLHDWPKGFDVMASSSQNQVSLAAPFNTKAAWDAVWNNWESFYNGYYTAQLLTELKKPSIEGLPQAQLQVERCMNDLGLRHSGLDKRIQQPVSTFNLSGGGGCLDCWQKSDRETPRYALLCGSLHADLSEMQKALKKEYGLSDRQIRVLNSPSIKAVKENIRQLGLRANHTLKKGKQPELLLFIGGHGDAIHDRATRRARYRQEDAVRACLIDEVYDGDGDTYFDAYMNSWTLPGEKSKLTPAERQRWDYFDARYKNATDEIGRQFEEVTLEGQKQGRVQLSLHAFHSLREEDVKDWVANYIPEQAKGLVIVHACHSGSWTG